MGAGVRRRWVGRPRRSGGAPPCGGRPEGAAGGCAWGVAGPAVRGSLASEMRQRGLGAFRREDPRCPGPAPRRVRRAAGGHWGAGGRVMVGLSTLKACGGVVDASQLRGWVRGTAGG